MGRPTGRKKDPPPKITKCCITNGHECRFADLGSSTNSHIVILTDNCIQDIPYEKHEEGTCYRGILELGWGHSVKEDEWSIKESYHILSPRRPQYKARTAPARRPQYISFLRRRSKQAATNVPRPGTKNTTMNIDRHIKQTEDMKRALQRTKRALQHLGPTTTRKLVTAYFGLKQHQRTSDSRIAAECPFILIDKQRKMLIMSNNHKEAIVHLELTAHYGPTIDPVNKHMQQLNKRIETEGLNTEQETQMAQAANRMMDIATHIPPHEAYEFKEVIKHMIHYIDSNNPSSTAGDHTNLQKMSKIIDETPAPHPQMTKALAKWDYGTTYDKMCNILDQINEIAADTQNETGETEERKNRVNMEMEKWRNRLNKTWEANTRQQSGTINYIYITTSPEHTDNEDYDVQTRDIIPNTTT